MQAVIKTVLGRVRPLSVHWLVYESGPSFPNGHVAFAVFLFGTLFLIYLGKIKSDAGKFFFVLSGVLLTLLVGFSRIYVGVHYPSDVLGGLLLGLAILGFTAPIYSYFTS